MSTDTCGPKTLTEAGAYRVKYESPLNLLGLCISLGVLALAYLKQPDVIPWLFAVGVFGAVLLILSAIGSWLANWLTKWQIFGEEIAKSVGELAKNQNILTRVVIAVLEQNNEIRDTLVIVGDNATERAGLIGMLQGVAHKHGLRIVAVTNLDDAIDKMHSARVAIFEVSLRDNDSPGPINMLLRIHEKSCGMVVLSHTKYQPSDFPSARAVLHKDETSRIADIVDHLFVQA